MLAVIMVGASFAPPLPAQIVPWWEDDSCKWFNGTIIDKEIINTSPGQAEYKFWVNGTLDNETEVQMVIYGDPIHYLVIKEGMIYEGTVCNTLPLREAILNGTIHLIDVVFS